MAPRDDKKLSKIKTGAISRGFSLAKLGVAAGARVASNAMGSLFSDEQEKAERLKEMLMAQAGALAKELGSLKGSLMKVGQMLSMAGENLFSPEVNAILKSLQNQSPPLAWEAIEPVLKAELGARLDLLEIDREPWASASLGQVHRATLKSDGRKLAVKIQYPGVDRAIDSDLAALRSLFSVSKLIPKGPRYDEIFAEVREMLYREVDYRLELAETRKYRERFKDDPRYVVPEVFEELSTARVLTTSFQEGVAVDGPEVQALSQERRDRLAFAAIELYFLELFKFRAIQSDPHFGNYRVQLAQEGGIDRLVLLDFGAMRYFDEGFMRDYRDMVRATVEKDRALLRRSGLALGFVKEEDPEPLFKAFAEVCEMFGEPYEAGAYDWAASDLPKRIKRKATELALATRLRPPPRQIVFLDRKMAGVFIFLSVMKAKIQARDLLLRYLA